MATHKISGHLIARVPDITRLIDRLLSREWVARSRSTRDRRVVLVHITDQGRHMVDAANDSFLELHRELFGRLTAAQLRTLHDLLARFNRSGAPT